MAVITYLEAISQGLREEMRRDSDVIILGSEALRLQVVQQTAPAHRGRQRE